MKRNKFSTLLGVVALIWSAGTLAHHSVAGEYGSSNEEMVPLEGVVTKVRWNAPHIEIYIEGSGGIAVDGEKMIINSHAPGLLARTYGILPGEVSVGDQVRFLGWRSKFSESRYHMRALSINGGPLRSTHRPSDKRDLREGTLGDVVVSPGLTEEDEYGSNLGNAAPPSQTPSDSSAQEVAPVGSKTVPIVIAIILLIGIVAVVVMRKKS
jgi:hypothetical protein